MCVRPLWGLLHNNKQVSRVVLITQGVSRIVMPILVQRYVEVCGIAESAERGYNPHRTKRMSLPQLVKDVRKLAQPKKSLSAVAKTHHLPYFLLHKENMSEFADWLKALRINFVIIYSMSQLLPKEITSVLFFHYIAKLSCMALLLPSLPLHCFF